MVVHSYTMHGILKDQIELWKPSTTPLSQDFNSEEVQAAATAEIIRYGLRICLATAMAGSLVSDPETLDTIHSHIRAILDASRIVGDSRWATILSWPLVVAGSCMTNPAQREELVMQLKSSRYYMKHVLVFYEVLQSLWETDSPHAFGPYRLYLMEQKGFYISVL